MWEKQNQDLNVDLRDQSLRTFLFWLLSFLLLARSSKLIRGWYSSFSLSLSFFFGNARFQPFSRSDRACPADRGIQSSCGQNRWKHKGATLRSRTCSDLYTLSAILLSEILLVIFVLLLARCRRCNCMLALSFKRKVETTMVKRGL